MKELTDRQKKRRADILTAARELIVEHGYDGVTMRELAARSDVALKTLYQQYENKENLLSRAVEELHSNTYAEIMKVTKDTGLETGVPRVASQPLSPSETGNRLDKIQCKQIPMTSGLHRLF